jgi:hypothetical protein
VHRRHSLGAPSRFRLLAISKKFGERNPYYNGSAKLTDVGAFVGLIKAAELRKQMRANIGSPMGGASSLVMRTELVFKIGLTVARAASSGRSCDRGIAIPDANEPRIHEQEADQIRNDDTGSDCPHPCGQTHVVVQAAWVLRYWPLSLGPAQAALRVFPSLLKKRLISPGRCDEGPKLCAFSR